MPASRQRFAAGFAIAAGPAFPVVNLPDVLFPVGLSRQTDLFQYTEQFGSNRGCVLHANTTILVPNETVRDIGLERVFEQQAIGCDLVPVSVTGATGSRTVPGLDLDRHNSLKDADHVVGFARQTVSLRGNRPRLRKLGAHVSREDVSAWKSGGRVPPAT